MIVMLRKHAGALKAADEASAEALAGIKMGEVVSCQIKRPRNLAHHRLFWALMQKVAENQSHYADAEQVCAAFKIATGHCDYVQTSHGMVGIPKSISFSKMSQEEFRAFFNKALDYLTTHVIPGLDSKTLEREVNDMIAVKV